MPGIPFDTNYSFITLTNPLVCKYDFMERNLGVALGVSVRLKSDLLSDIKSSSVDYALLRLTDMNASVGGGNGGIYYGLCATSGYNYGGKLYRIYAPASAPPTMKECTTYEMGNLIWPLNNTSNSSKIYLMVLLAVISYTAYNSSYSYTNLVYSTAWFTASGTNEDITTGLYVDQIAHTGLTYNPGGIKSISITFYPKYGWCPTTLNTDASGMVTTLISSLVGSSYSTGTLRFNSDSSSGTLKYVRICNYNYNPSYPYQWWSYLNPVAGTAELFNSNTGHTGTGNGPATATDFYKILVGSATFNGGSHRLFITPCWYLPN